MAAPRLDLRALPEAALVYAAQERDRAAFAELVRRREAWLRALLGRLTGDAAEADDLAQEAFLRAWRRLDGLQRPAAFGSWLRQLAVHLFVDTRRLAKLDISPQALPEDLASEAPAPDRSAEARIDLDRALELLTPVERLCVTLNLGEGLSHAEVVHATGLALGTVKSHILRATQKVRRLHGASDE